MASDKLASQEQINQMKQSIPAQQQFELEAMGKVYKDARAVEDGLNQQIDRKNAEIAGLTEDYGNVIAGAGGTPKTAVYAAVGGAGAWLGGKKVLDTFTTEAAQKGAEKTVQGFEEFVSKKAHELAKKAIKESGDASAAVSASDLTDAVAKKYGKELADNLVKGEGGQAFIKQAAENAINEKGKEVAVNKILENASKAIETTQVPVETAQQAAEAATQQAAGAATQQAAGAAAQQAAGAAAQQAAGAATQQAAEAATQQATQSAQDSMVQAVNDSRNDLHKGAIEWGDKLTKNGRGKVALATVAAAGTILGAWKAVSDRNAALDKSASINQQIQQAEEQLAGMHGEANKARNIQADTVNSILAAGPGGREGFANQLS